MTALSPQEIQLILDAAQRAPLANLAAADQLRVTLLKFVDWYNGIGSVHPTTATQLDSDLSEHLTNAP